MNKYREVECGGCAPPVHVPLREGKTRGLDDPLTPDEQLAFKCDLQHALSKPAARDPVTTDRNSEGAVGWQRRITPDNGKSLAWEYFAGAVDYDNDPAKFPATVGRWSAEYRPLFLAPSAAEVQALVERAEDLLHKIEGFGRAYPTDIFSEPTKDEREWLHATRPGLMDRIAANMGRHVWSCIEKDVAAIRDELAKLIPRNPE